MKKQLTLIFLLLTTLLSAESYDHLLQLPITAISVSGNRVYSTDYIISKAGIKTRLGNTIETELIRSDLKRIMSLGGFSAVSFDYRPYRLGVEVVYVVQENPLIEKIKLHNFSVISEERLKASLKTKENEQLNFNSLDRDIEKINNIYKKNSYDLSSVSKVEMADKARVDFYFYEPVIEEIVVTGNIFTNSELIKRQFDSQPGALYNSKKLNQDRARIFSLGYFSAVSLPEVVPGEKTGSLKIKITVVEKKKNTLNFGLGVSSREKFAFARLNLLNIFNTGEQFFFSFQSGQEYRDDASYPKLNYRFRYFNPWIFQRDLSFGYSKYMNVAYETLRNPEADEILQIRRDGYSFDAGFPLPFGRQYRFIAEYKDETVEEAGLSPRIKYLNKSCAGTYLYNGLEMLEESSIVIDGELYKIRLEKGGKLDISQEVSIGFGGVDFYRADIQFSRFIPLSEGNNIIGVSYKGGSYSSDREQNILEGEEYSMGGSNTVRGYAEVSPFAVGPKMTLINFEYRYIFNKQLQGVLFYDWGNAYTDVNVSVKEFKSGYGFGLRFSTPLGPIRFDLGRGERYWVFHFGLGYNF